jgi:hypothetical protein
MLLCSDCLSCAYQFFAAFSYLNRIFWPFSLIRSHRTLMLSNAGKPNFRALTQSNGTGKKPYSYAILGKMGHKMDFS